MAYDPDQVAKAIIDSPTWGSLDELRVQFATALNAAFRAGESKVARPAYGPRHSRSRPLPALKDFRTG